MILNDVQQQFWKKNSYIKLNDFLSEEVKSHLANWVGELESLPETPGKWMMYFEKTKGNERQLCRLENFLQYHEGFNEIARGEKTMKLLAELMGEEAALYKEKINFKFPGANGFTPHQDYPAFLGFGQTYHITMMLAIDDSTVENGCLRVSAKRNYRDHVLPQESDKTISRDVVKGLEWEPVECKAGDVLLFDSFLPHYSEANLSSLSRKAAFITYNRMADGGSKREEYYADKRKNFPQECERVPGKDYSAAEKIYNVANPITNKVVGYD